MDRTGLGRKLRQIAKLGRYVRDQRKRLERRMAPLEVTEGELELLVSQVDGYLLVLDAREKGKHITLSDADEVSIRRAQAREAKRSEEMKKKRQARQAENERQKEERKKLKLEKKKKKMLELIHAMAIGGSIEGEDDNE